MFFRLFGCIQTQEENVAMWPSSAIVCILISNGVKTYSIPKEDRLTSYKLSYKNAHMIVYADLI